MVNKTVSQDCCCPKRGASTRSQYGQRVVERFTRGGHTIQTSHGDTIAMDTHHAHMHGGKHMIHSTSCRHCPEQTAGEGEVISGATKRRNNTTVSTTLDTADTSTHLASWLNENDKIPLSTPPDLILAQRHHHLHRRTSPSTVTLESPFVTSTYVRTPTLSSLTRLHGHSPLQARRWPTPHFHHTAW
jgi:hypothetical protein